MIPTRKAKKELPFPDALKKSKMISNKISLHWFCIPSVISLWRYASKNSWKNRKDDLDDADPENCADVALNIPELFILCRKSWSQRWLFIDEVHRSGDWALTFSLSLRPNAPIKRSTTPSTVLIHGVPICASPGHQYFSPQDVWISPAKKYFIKKFLKLLIEAF